MEIQQGDERASYGNAVLEKLSQKLTNEFGKGFSSRNLRTMRKFYLIYSIWKTVPAKLSWSHCLELIKIDEEQKRNFYKSNIERIAKKLGVIIGAKEYIYKLHEDGHSIFIITGRDNGECTEPYNMTKEWLDNNDIYYDDLILTNAYDKHAKAVKCIELNIDIMIDDSVCICSDCIENGITTILMDTPYNRYSDIQRVKSWKEFYEYVSNYKNSKINIILDTDTYNECDDQFALSYLIKSKDLFNIEAITVAPYSHQSRNVSVIEGQELGAITNIALALKKEPKIINKIEIIWLGGNEFGYKDNLEYNFRQDIEAVKIVLNSKVKLTILPCKNVASN